MQQMPYQTYVCPTCNSEIESNSIYVPLCHTKGCKWIDMRPADELNKRSLSLMILSGIGIIAIVLWGVDRWIGEVLLPWLLS